MKKDGGEEQLKKDKKSGNASTGPHAFRANVDLKLFLYYKKWTRLHPKARLFLTPPLDPFKMCGLLYLDAICSALRPPFITSGASQDLITLPTRNSLLRWCW